MKSKHSPVFSSYWSPSYAAAVAVPGWASALAIRVPSARSSTGRPLAKSVLGDGESPSTASPAS